MKSILFQLARYLSRLGGGGWFAWLFVRVYRWLPFRPLYTSKRLLVIYHPRPSYPFHVLLVPRQALKGLQDIHADESGLLLECLQTAAQVAQGSGLQKFRIVINGGAYQDIPQLHFHLIAN